MKDTTTYYIFPKLYHRKLRPAEKAYMFWYIERLKPLYLQDKEIINERYTMCNCKPPKNG